MLLVNTGMNPTFPPGPQVGIHNRLVTAPVPEKDLQYWRGTGHRYHSNTTIGTGSVLALFRSRLLANT